MTKQDRRAIENARGWYASIEQMLAATRVVQDEDACDDANKLIQSTVVAVKVRSGWHSPGTHALSEEYSILLTTSGPALRIIGDLSEHFEPETARMQYQDWRTWTDAEGIATEATLLEFAAHFYFAD